MRAFLYSLPFFATVGSAQAADAPKQGPYIFTGTATVISGGSNCLGSSPLSITGDAVVAGKGNTLAIHIKSTSDVSAVGLDFKNINLRYGAQSSGTLSYVLVPQTATYTGTYSSAVATKQKNGRFEESVTVVSGPFLIGQSGSCEIGLDLNNTPGVNKALLKLLAPVL